ncbi:hypothetical protein B0H19DRAFT_1377432 [Mycena capillaripes]|nr:hypothetical protein B0H19DRAFT_1377432 [Mycena capillaripes]
MSALCPWLPSSLFSVSSRIMQSLKYSGYALLLLATCHWLELCPSSRTGFDSCRELFGLGLTPIDRARREACARPMKTHSRHSVLLLYCEGVDASLPGYKFPYLSFVCHNADLRIIENSDDDTNDDDEFPEHLNQTIPAKRAHTGTARNKMYRSTDLKSEGWSNFISDCVREELALFPSNPLTLIVGDKTTAGAAGAASALSSFGGRLHGALRDGVADSRQPLVPSNAGNTMLPALPVVGARQPVSSLDRMMLTPTPFTFGSTSVPSSASPMFTFGNSSSYPPAVKLSQ